MSAHNETALFARTALLPSGWQSGVRVVMAAGRVLKVVKAATPEPGDEIVDLLIPALANLHSHTFQRAMAGMTEHRSAGRDNFWSWRDLMYRFLDHLTPDHIEAIAALAFMENLEAGFAAVAEFHYVHHQKGGAPYANLAELSDRIAAAATHTGIGLTLLPVLYTYGGAREQPLHGGQLRFGNDPSRFMKLWQQASTTTLAANADNAVGIAPHSLRATSPQHLHEIATNLPGHQMHIHAAEQMKEVEEVSIWLGARPVQWLLANADVDQSWCLVHATHLTTKETTALAASGAVAGLCPITESNLGDGIFDAGAFVAAHGAFGIGTDSNIRISANEELRTLEYSQRLRHQSRNVLATEAKSTGRALYERALAGGSQALGRAAGSIAEGQWADLVALNGDDLTFAALNHDQFLDGWIFAAGNGVIKHVWSAGRPVVRDGNHIHRQAITARYLRAMLQLKSVL